MVVTGCFVVTSDGFHRAAIAASTGPVIGRNVCVAGMRVEACPSEVDDCVPSSNDIDLSGLVSLPPDILVAFPIIVSV